MVRVLFGLLVIALIFQIYAIVDCALFDRLRVRGLPKVWWIVVLVVIPVVGAGMWFLIGRGRASRLVPPDDDDEFLRHVERELFNPDENPGKSGPVE